MAYRVVTEDKRQRRYRGLEGTRQAAMRLKDHREWVRIVAKGHVAYGWYKGNLYVSPKDVDV